MSFSPVRHNGIPRASLHKCAASIRESRTPLTLAMATSSLPSMANPLQRPFHLAAISLVLLALVPHSSPATASTSISLPPSAPALHTGARDDAPSSATGRILLRAPAFSDRLHAPPSLQSVGGSSAPRRLLVTLAVAWGQKDQAATAPSQQAAAPLRTRRAHHARAAAQARYRHYEATLANLHFVCQPPFCFADSDHDLLAVLYGLHTGGRWHDSVYGIVRTIEGTSPILCSPGVPSYIPAATCATSRSGT